MLQDWCVKVHSKSFVVPNPCNFNNNSSSNLYVYPSAFDQLLRRVTLMQQVLFYKPEEVAEFCEFVEILKRGLAEALVVFFPLAGRLEIDKESGLPRILCNGAGIEFLEASIDAKLEDLGADLQPRDIPLEKLFSEFRPAVDATDTPFLSVQIRVYLDKVTQFQCGGIAVAYSYNHYVADGAAIWHFMKSWSKAARNLLISLIPSHKRTPLRLPHAEPSAKDRSHSELYDSIDVNCKPIQGGSRQLSMPETVQQLFTFNKEMLQTLKSLANTGELDGESPACTTYEALYGHIWRSATKARVLPPNEITKFNVTVDCRQRVCPSPPPSLFGNMLCNVLALSTAGELGSNDLGFAARLVQAAIKQKANSTKVQELLDWMGRQGNKYFRYNLGLTNDFGVAGSSRFPCFEVDFGWGAPVAVRAGASRWSGTISIFPAHECGAIDVTLTLPPDAICRLASDSEFLEPSMMALSM